MISVFGAFCFRATCGAGDLAAVMQKMTCFRFYLLASIAPAGLLALSACGQPGEGQSNDAAEAALAQSDAVSSSGADAANEIEPNGTVIEILMYTVDPDDSSRQHVFKPRLVTAKVGDTIRFVPTEPSHQSSSISAMLPDGVRGWEGDINEEFSYVLPAPGIYGHQCVPHYAAGMVGVIIVEGEGKTDNLDFAKMSGHPGLGVPQFVEIFAEAEELGLLD